MEYIVLKRFLSIILLVLYKLYFYSLNVQQPNFRRQSIIFVRLKIRRQYKVMHLDLLHLQNFTDRVIK